MGEFVPWNSQPLDDWEERYAEVINYAGHLVNFDQAAAFNELLIDFLGDRALTHGQ